MIKELIKYPQTPSKEFNAPVRFFDEKLTSLIEDLKDTIEANNLPGLSAVQIGSPYNVVVVKKDNKFLTLINPKIYQSKGTITSEEKSVYFGDITATVTRSQEIKIAYENENKETKYLTAADDFAILLQRKIDYTFGGNIRYRLDEQGKEEFDLKLEYGNDVLQNGSCPTTFVKDKISNLTKYITAFSFVALLGAIFINDENKLLLATAENYSMMIILALIIIYVPYGYYEGKSNKGCTSCQIGNILGTATISLLKLLILFILNYFIF